MIPYDDLVVALTTWRARQGLPVAAAAAATAAAHVPAPKTTSPGLGPAPGSGPRTAPPRPPGRGSITTPPPLAAVDTHDDPMDVDSAALIEESHYENDGDDFAMAFDSRNQVAHEAEATAIGVPPPPNRDSFGGATEPGEADDVPPRRGHDDW